MGVVIETKSRAQTQKVGRMLAESIMESDIRGPVVVALEGELGSGKTTFVQGFAKALGIREKALSPTFVLMKIYPLASNSKLPTPNFQSIVHLDCYRIESPDELPKIGFKNLLRLRDAIILIEWADRVKKLIPRAAIRIRFEHGKGAHERRITIGFRK